MAVICLIGHKQENLSDHRQVSMLLLRSFSDQLAIHSRTPGLVVSDPRGLGVRSVGYYRREPSTAAQARTQVQWHDAAGRAMAQWDPRQFASFQNGQTETPNQHTVFALSGAPLRQQSVDFGWKVMLHSAEGRASDSWNSNGTHTQTLYDGYSRLCATQMTDAEGNRRIVQRIDYWSSDQAHTAYNRRGAIRRHDDESGSVQFDSYTQRGQLILQHRQLLEGIQPPDWPALETERDTLLEQQPAYATHTCFDATGAVLGTTDAVGNERHHDYDICGLERGARLTTAAGVGHELMTAIEYSAQAQLLSQKAGNGVVSRYLFCERTQRLVGLHSARSSGETLQDLRYEHDPAGNVLAITDNSQAIRHFANQRTEPVSRFTYDSFGQLIAATGREAAGAAVEHPQLPELGPLTDDANALINYTQTFTYDEAGNLLQLRHVNGQRNFTRNMAVARFSNRALPEHDGLLPDESQVIAGFDSNGNLRQLGPGQQLIWDAYNQLHQVTAVPREDGIDDAEVYVYGIDGQRVRKIASAQLKSGTRVTQVRYLPGLEIRTDSRSGEELHVLTLQAGHGNIRFLHWQAGKPDALANDQLRYSLDNHLGSACMELDAQARLISREEYYPFGGTACRTGRNALEAKYKTVRYSGQERDASGLYYYGLRYYAPWLQRWINPDPAGDVDGLNLFCMVGNDPINKVDNNGTQGDEPSTAKAKRPSVVDDFLLGIVQMGGAVNVGMTRKPSMRATAAQRQQRTEQKLLADRAMQRKFSLLMSMFALTKTNTGAADASLQNMEDHGELAKALTHRTGAIILSNAASTGSGMAIGAGVGFLALGPVGAAGGMVVGGIVGKVVSIATDKAMEKTGVKPQLHLRTGSLNPHSVKHEGIYHKESLAGKFAYKMRGFYPDSKKNAVNLGMELTKQVGSKLAGPAGIAVKIGVDIAKAGYEANKALEGKDVDKVQRLVDDTPKLMRDLYERTLDVSNYYAANQMDPGQAVNSITLGDLARKMGKAMDRINETQSRALSFIDTHRHTERAA
jgi:RHS repeat-associated protein